MTPISKGERIYLGAVAFLALWVGVFCYFNPAWADGAIPWRVAPLCAGFLGAMYLSGAVFNGASMLAGRWSDARVIMPMIAMWTGGLTIVSLFYLPAFNFARPQVWVWFGAYIVYPLIALALMWRHRGQRAEHPAGEPALPPGARWYLRGQGASMIGLGLALLLAPRAMEAVWPWQTGRLMLQLYSAPLLSYGIGSFILARQRAWSEIRIGLAAMGVFTGAGLAASLRFAYLLNGPAPAVTA
ncbi:MAG: hypothetical protein ABI847_14475, partial [Anaerolineales bacterium]